MLLNLSKNTIGQRIAISSIYIMVIINAFDDFHIISKIFICQLYTVTGTVLQSNCAASAQFGQVDVETCVKAATGKGSGNIGTQIMLIDFSLIVMAATKRAVGEVGRSNVGEAGSTVDSRIGHDQLGVSIVFVTGVDCIPGTIDNNIVDNHIACDLINKDSTSAIFER